jgi:hypothetical protein
MGYIKLSRKVRSRHGCLSLIDHYLYIPIPQSRWESKIFAMAQPEDSRRLTSINMLPKLGMAARDTHAQLP